MITKKGDGSQVKESTDSSTTIEDDDVKGMFHYYIFVKYFNFFFSFRKCLCYWYYKYLIRNIPEIIDNYYSITYLKRIMLPTIFIVSFSIACAH